MTQVAQAVESTNSPTKQDKTNIWQTLLRQNATRSKSVTSTILLAGNRDTGKGMLIRRLSQSTIKPTSDDRTVVLSSGNTLSYTSFDVYDPNDTDSNDDAIANVGIWMMSDIRQQPLLQFALKPALLTTSVILLAVDLSQPWSIKLAIEQWIQVFEKEVASCSAILEAEEKQDLLRRIENHFLSYEDGGVRRHSRTRATALDPAANRQLPENALTSNLGIPIVVVGCKSDELPADDVIADYIQYYLRKFCLQYGAALCYTSAKLGTNCDVLRRYVLYRTNPDVFSDTFDSPQVIEQDSIFVPSGFDSSELIEESLVGASPKWSRDIAFEEIVPVPKEDDPKLTSFESSVKVEDEQTWLENLQKSGANTASPDKKTRTIGERENFMSTTSTLSQSPVVMTAASDKSSKPAKDVNPTHLANFFNNLLTRSEKDKKGRNTKEAKEDAAKLRQLAKNELSNMK